ncbi:MULTISPECIES: mobile element protein [Streptomyces]|uniref:Mobile element protein n=1 Tax=Streptomyces rimosus subsp. rimosus (strain ATCC 10970 / DSM 40260 / JCM 4667 / NRRL 2234) TaxID=1265868 RepID=A0A8A1UP43_STRR1|nr:MULTISPECIES: mobile element protein [Streptomyces]KUJ67443.1 mobile element protein [Streptomyces albus subsp. albus]MYT47289.1 mobile element protein [Streptomyces sp. SID5471]KEF04622.1 mobile element protein [Streptomyces rimosus]QDA09760.1 mobile element protein [Streptomyces rimosus]QEV81035.1 mobile element protein [Streptomyces rimosus]
MATDEFLADPAELSTWTGRPETDPKLLAALRAASRRFRGAVGHRITLVLDDMVTLDGGGRTSLLLPVWPTIAVTQVRVDGTALVAAADFDWSEAGLLRRLGCGQRWPDRLHSVEVTYSHGWAEVPEDIQEAVIDQARTMLALRPAVQAMQTGGQTITYGAQAAVGVTDQWARAVARHKVRTSGDA